MNKILAVASKLLTFTLVDETLSQSSSLYRIRILGLLVLGYETEKKLTNIVAHFDVFFFTLDARWGGG